MSDDMRAHWRIVLAIAGVLATGACGDRRGPLSDPIGEVTGKDVAGLRLHRAEDRGHELFKAYCATCHGDEGAGDGQNASRLAPRPPDLRAALRSGGREHTRRVIESGSAAVGRSALCPPRGRQLSPDQVDGLLAYLARLARGSVPG